MRQGQQHRRGRGRNNISTHNPGNRKGQNPLTRSYESSGPDVKVRGTPAHVAEKYMQLARDAQSSGDHVLAENYLQHAEHYNRIILAFREQQAPQSGEAMNGHGRHQGSRHDMQDGDDGSGDDDMGADDMGGVDQPLMGRHPGDQPRGDMQPSFDEPRSPPQHSQRNDQHPRFRDRHMRGDRGDRHDRQDGFDRNGRQDRNGDRGFDRTDRNDRNRDRPYRQSEQPIEAREMSPPREPREMREPREVREPREMREHREPREVREPREPREMREPREPREPRHQPNEAVRDLPRESAPPSVAPEMPSPDAEAPAPVRPEGSSSRRRERFGLSADQPEFLRRPVRRPRREVEQEFTPESPAPSPSPADEPPRE